MRQHNHGLAHDKPPVSPDYGHLHAATRRPEPQKMARVRWALIITAAVMLLEVAGGLIANSLALLSDAGHMLTHIFALGMSYFASVISTRPATPERTFGYFRAEVLAAFVNGLLLFAVTGYIFYEAVGRMMHPVKILPAHMLAVALVGLAANVASVLLLSGISERDLNLRSAFVHVVYDTVSSVAVVTAAAVIHLSGLRWFDPAVSMLIGVLILVWAARIVRASVHILLESKPKDVDLDRVRRDIGAVPGVRGVHDIHVWQITTSMYVMTAHVIVDRAQMARAVEIVDSINRPLREHHRIGHSTLQLECGVSEEQERTASPREWGPGNGERS